MRADGARLELDGTHGRVETGSMRAGLVEAVGGVQEGHDRHRSVTRGGRAQGHVDMLLGARERRWRRSGRGDVRAGRFDGPGALLVLGRGSGLPGGLQRARLAA